MEDKLIKWFRLAEKWGAVILIDEADVYLERRQATDLKRNSLVSGTPLSIESDRVAEELTQRSSVPPMHRILPRHHVFNDEPRRSL